MVTKSWTRNYYQDTCYIVRFGGLYRNYIYIMQCIQLFKHYPRRIFCYINNINFCPVQIYLINLKTVLENNAANI
jgi:hypothetical protein